MATLINTHLAEDTAVIGSRLGRMDPDNFRNQRPDSDDDLNNEPVDAESDLTGEHDHHQDDNYTLGGHVTRSGSL